MSNDKVFTYPGEAADVTWDGRLCIHVGECGRASNDLFVSGRKPWCVPDAVTLEEVVDVVDRCPTGALAYTARDGETHETPDAHNVAIVQNDGPLYLRGDLELEDVPDGMPGVSFRMALCRCGLSKKKPFCDNSHVAGNFRDHGAVGPSGDGLEAEGGKLRLRAIPNGPVLVNGNLTIKAASGRVAWKGSKCALCRCGQSKNKPFCDGSHKAAGFEAP